MGNEFETARKKPWVNGLSIFGGNQGPIDRNMCITVDHVSSLEDRADNTDKNFNILFPLVNEQIKGQLASLTLTQNQTIPQELQKTNQAIEELQKQLNEMRHEWTTQNEAITHNLFETGTKISALSERMGQISENVEYLLGQMPKFIRCVSKQFISLLSHEKTGTLDSLEAMEMGHFPEMGNLLENMEKQED